MHNVESLMKFNQQQAIEFLANVAKTGELKLKHPYKNITTFARQNKRYRKANVIMFSDSKQQNHWYLIQVYNLVDGYICKKETINPRNIGEVTQLDDLIRNQEFQFNNNNSNTKLDGLVFSQRRPYHYFYDQFINFFHLSEIIPDIAKYCFTDRNCFYNELPNNQRLNEASENGCYIYPCTQGGQYDSNNAEKMHRFLQKNTTPKKFESDFTLWFGITAQKRSWLEQSTACVKIVKELKKHYNSITIIIDGMTCLANGIAENPKDIKRDMTVFESITSQLDSVQNINFINLIGKSYKEKIDYSCSIDCFIANSGGGCMVPMVFTNALGVIHTNGQLNTFKKLYNRNVRIVPNEKTITRDSSLDSDSYSIEWSVVYNLMLDLISIDEKIPEKKLFNNKLYFTVKRFIFKKSIQIGVIWKKLRKQ